MKTALFLLSALLTAQAHAATDHPAHLSVVHTPSTGVTKANIYYQGGVLGDRLFDALSLSSEMEEVKNQWVPAGTTFRSRAPGIEITKDKTGVVEITFTMQKTDSGELAAGTNALILSFEGEEGLGRLFHKALLASRSPHVLTKGHPGEVIEPRGDQATILSAISFSGQYVNCSSNEFRPGSGHCSLTLDRN